MKKSIATALAVIILASGFYGCQSDPVKYQATFFLLFNTMTMVIGYEKSENDFKAVAEQFQQELEQYHQLYDIYNDYDNLNNIKTINDNAGIKPVEVDKRIIDLLEFGKESYELTGGLTNMAMGSVLKIWHTYREQGIDNPTAASVPTLEELEQAAEHMDINKVIIDKEKSTVYLADPAMSLDVGSLGKGYAVEQVCEIMQGRGVDSYLLNVGGNVRCIGTKPDGKMWESGVENPDDKSDYLDIVNMADNSLVISGNYQRYYIADGQKYHHIINPNTLMPENYVAAVAILCADSGRADAASTAVFNMTVEDGVKWVEDQPDLEAMWMLNDKTIRYSSGFEANLKQDN